MMNQRTVMQRSAAFATLVVVGLQAGCTQKPVAPVLRDDPVYHNSREGFRFLAPEGWSQQARAELPPGPLDKERLLVQYKRLTADEPAGLEVTMADLPETTDLTEYLAGPSYGVQKWQAGAKVEPVETSGATGERRTFTARLGKTDVNKEVVTFRRGPRVYIVTGIFSPRDNTARDQVRRAVASLVWEK